ncbi:MAG: AAA family ATPase, partial [Candidatus Thermoplasmatota archaeon]|nr:AAA family ATPase [Candidatus Thermoplasmatota archaeon]
MTLQRINTVEIENFRSYSVKKIFNFEDGFNLISGENGAGKTSLRLAIVLGLFSRPGGKGLESIMRNGNKPVVKIEFVAKGCKYTINKTFSKSPKNGIAVLTNLDTNERIDNTPEAVLRCRQLVTGTEESIINNIDGKITSLAGEVTKILGNNMGSLLFPEQGRLVELFETNDVLKSIGLDKDTLTTNNDLEKLILRTDTERKERLTKGSFDFKFDLENKTTSNMAANKILHSKFKAASLLSESVENNRNTESKLQDFYLDLERLKSEQESVSEGENSDEQANDLEQSAEEHRKKREVAEEKTSLASRELENSEKLQK